MRNRKPTRVAGRRLCVPNSEPRRTIKSLVESGVNPTNALVTVYAPHGFAGGELVYFTGATGVTYSSSPYEVAADPAPSGLTFEIAGVYSSDTAGGYLRVL